MSVTERTRAVTNHAAEYTQWFRSPFRPPEAKVDAALMLLASGRGPARAATCKHTLRRAHFSLDSSDAPTSAVLVRAFSLCRKGELRELRVGDPKVFDLIVNAIQQAETLLKLGCTVDAPPRGGAAAISSTEEGAARVLESLSTMAASSLTTPEGGLVVTRALESLSYVGSYLYCGTASAFAIIERHSDTVTEIDCLFDTPDGARHASRVLPSCKRLEILTCASHEPSVWLGLSQLHTLRGVNLEVVTFAAVAAALPRLHTLDVFSYGSASPESVVGFFEDLLPRLRSFHFTGCWPRGEELTFQTSATASTSSLQDLPVLRELVLNLYSTLDFRVAREFMGARPVLLRLPYASLANADRLPVANSTSNAETSIAAAFLSHVRNLELLGPIDDGPSGLARVLRAAPQLRTFTAIRMEGDFLLASSPPEGFAGLIHPWLRSMDIEAWDSVPADGIAQLRQLYFPRLRRLTFDKWSPDVYHAE